MRAKYPGCREMISIMREFLFVTIQEIWKLALLPLATLLSKLMTWPKTISGNRIRSTDIINYSLSQGILQKHCLKTKIEVNTLSLFPLTEIGAQQPVLHHLHDPLITLPQHFLLLLPYKGYGQLFEWYLLAADTLFVVSFHREVLGLAITKYPYQTLLLVPEEPFVYNIQIILSTPLLLRVHRCFDPPLSILQTPLRYLLQILLNQFVQLVLPNLVLYQLLQLILTELHQRRHNLLIPYTQH